VTSSTFPGRFREARHRAGLSVRGMAAAAEVAPRSVVHWETGETDPDRGMVERLAAALGVSASWLAYGHKCEDEPKELSMLSLSSKSEVRALATHAYYNYRASQSRPLTPSSPAENERAEEEWDGETSDLDSVASAARAKIADVAQVLSVLSNDGPAGQRARGIARDQLNRLGCNRPFTLHGYGPGWNEMPKVSV